MDDAIRKYKATVFQAMAHSTRVAICELLRDEECPAGTLKELLQLEQANVSQHLAILRSAGILNSRKVGNSVLYSLRDQAITEVLDILRVFCYKRTAEMVQMLEGSERESQRSDIVSIE